MTYPIALMTSRGDAEVAGGQVHGVQRIRLADFSDLRVGLERCFRHTHLRGLTNKLTGYGGPESLQTLRNREGRRSPVQRRDTHEGSRLRRWRRRPAGSRHTTANRRPSCVTPKRPRTPDSRPASSGTPGPSSSASSTTTARNAAPAVTAEKRRQENAVPPWPWKTSPLDGDSLMTVRRIYLAYRSAPRKCRDT
jgi:hypothetical protein